MDLITYSTEVERTRAKLKTEQLDNIHMLFGIMSECGELINAFKKEVAYGKAVDWVNVEEEIGDLMWFIVGFCNVNNIDLGKVLDQNVKKLKARYKEFFTATEAVERDISTERRVLEGVSQLSPISRQEMLEQFFGDKNGK